MAELIKLAKMVGVMHGQITLTLFGAPDNCIDKLPMYHS